MITTSCKVFSKIISLLNRWQILKILANHCATEAKFQTEPYRLHRLEQGPSSESSLKKEEAMKYFEIMSTIRKMENTIGNLYKAKKIRGFCHLYSGQEAVGVGIYSAVRPEDTVITSYRCHTWSYLYNKDGIMRTIAELLGVDRGCSRGKGGSMHMYGSQFFGGNGIVGAQVPLGVGIALSHQYKKTNGVSVTMYGDGAANNGQVFEVFNIAKLWSLPCIFVCENNQYGMGTSTSRAAANIQYYTRGDLIPGIWIDGMDFFSVREATRFAIEHCTSGKGPIVLEAYTYRYFGHSMSDPGTSYRTHEEVQTVRKTKDPITRFKSKIISAGLATEDEFKQMDAKAKKEVDEAAARAEEGKEIKVEELTYDVYSNDIVKQIRTTNPFKMAPHKITKRA